MQRLFWPTATAISHSRSIHSIFIKFADLCSFLYITVALQSSVCYYVNHARFFLRYRCQLRAEINERTFYVSKNSEKKGGQSDMIYTVVKDVTAILHVHV